MHHHELDDLDRKIIRTLLNDASMPYSEVAKLLQVSGGTIHVRMKKMIESGIIQGSHLVLNYSAVGFDITAFLGVFLDRGSAYRQVAEALRSIPEVIEVHFTTGGYSMFVKLVCRDTQHLREVLNEKIQGIEGVTRTETLISLEQTLNREITL